jgi:hypothetical protein
MQVTLVLEVQCHKYSKARNGWCLLHQYPIQGWEELLCDLKGITGCCQDTRRLPQIHQLPRVPPVHRPLSPDLATEFQESGRTDIPLGSASPRILYIQRLSGVQAHQHGCLAETMSIRKPNDTRSNDRPEVWECR